MNYVLISQFLWKSKLSHLEIKYLGNSNTVTYLEWFDNLPLFIRREFIKSDKDVLPWIEKKIKISRKC